MKHTTLSSYTTSSWEGSASGWTTVYQRNQTISTTGLVNFAFTTPFDYDGVRNLMIDFSYNNSTYTTDGEARYTTTPNNRTLHYRSDSDYGDPLNWSGTGSPTIPTPDAIARVPNIKLITGPTVIVTPSITGTFLNGVWTGLVTVDQSAVGVRLRASDTAGHTALSNPFDTTNSPPPVVTSPSAVTAVVNQPFSYQILASNLPTSYNASSLPAGLTVNPGSGLISGTPSASGTASATVSATNASGTGNAPLSIEVQADADQDGVGDVWETANGLDPGETGDANTDLDGDGQSNRAEWIAGTAANDANSRFTIVSQQSIGADVRVIWRSVIGKRYRLLTRTDLATGAWIDLTPTPVVATDTTCESTHAGGMSGPARYYQVEIAP